MKKIAFCCLPGLTTFIEPIVAALSKAYKTEIIAGNSLQEYAAKLADADIIWLEWGNQLAGAITQNILPLEKVKKVILRIHSYECLTPGMLEAINYGAVTDILFVSEFVRDYTIGLSPKTFEHLKVHTIPNGLDLDQFSICDFKADADQSAEGHITAGLLGHLNAKKGPMLLAQVINELFFGLPDKYEDISFKIGGQWQDPRHESYMMHFLEKQGLLMAVEFVDVPYGTANKFFEDIDVVLCTSPWESQNMSVMEGMAAGCKPAIHWFPGAEYHYDPAYLWNSMNELKDLVFHRPFDPVQYRADLARFDLQLIVDRIKADILE